MNTYSIKKQKGVDDLLCECAFIGNSQGDESTSNDIEVFKEAKGWMSYVFDVPMNAKAIAQEVKRRKQWNREYIKKLKKEGKYKEEYELTIHVKPNPLFDNPKVSSKLPFESHKLVFIDEIKNKKKWSKTKHKFLPR